MPRSLGGWVGAWVGGWVGDSPGRPKDENTWDESGWGKRGRGSINVLAFGGGCGGCGVFSCDDSSFTANVVNTLEGRALARDWAQKTNDRTRETIFTQRSESLQCRPAGNARRLLGRAWAAARQAWEPSPRRPEVSRHGRLENSRGSPLFWCSGARLVSRKRNLASST